MGDGGLLILNVFLTLSPTMFLEGELILRHSNAIYFLGIEMSGKFVSLHL